MILYLTKENMGKCNMSDKNLRKEDVRELFRPDPSLIYRHDLPAKLKDPGYIYKRVIYKVRLDNGTIGFYKNDPYHVQKHIDNGWEFVYAEGANKPAKLNSAQEKENLREDPIQVTSADGAVSFYMRISNQRFHENHAKRRKARDARLDASITKKRGNHEEDKEMIDFNKMAGIDPQK